MDLVVDWSGGTRWSCIGVRNRNAPSRALPSLTIANTIGIVLTAIERTAGLITASELVSNYLCDVDSAVPRSISMLLMRQPGHTHTARSRCYDRQIGRLRLTCGGWRPATLLAPITTRAER